MFLNALKHLLVLLFKHLCSRYATHFGAFSTVISLSLSAISLFGKADLTSQLANLTHPNLTSRIPDVPCNGGRPSHDGPYTEILILLIDLGLSLVAIYNSSHRTPRHTLHQRTLPRRPLRRENAFYIRNDRRFPENYLRFPENYIRFPENPSKP
jgi:hypothetical protein